MIYVTAADAAAAAITDDDDGFVNNDNFDKFDVSSCWCFLCKFYVFIRLGCRPFVREKKNG